MSQPYLIFIRIAPTIGSTKPQKGTPRCGFVNDFSVILTVYKAARYAAHLDLKDDAK